VTLLGACLVIVAFAALAHRCGLVAKTRASLAHTRTALEVLRSPGLDDAAKEAALQAGARTLGVLLLELLGGTALAALVPLAGVWLLDLAGLMSLAAVLDLLQRWDFLLAVAGIMTLAAWWWARRRR
jgi:hypothetical protein